MNASHILDGPPYPDPAELRQARRAAARRAALWSELFRWAVVTGVLLLLIRPVGVLVGLFWGISLWRRFSRSEVEPRLRERWTEQELRRGTDTSRRRSHRARRRARGHGTNGTRVPRDPAAELLVRLGDDPRTPENLEYARAALRDADALDAEDSPPSGNGASPDAGSEGARAEPLDGVRAADVMEEILAELAPSLRAAGIALHVEIDSAGALRADRAELGRVFRRLLQGAADRVTQAGVREPRVEVHMGENLARTHVWVRIRHNGPATGGAPERELRLSKHGED